jgi:hypothetical protein
MTPIDVAGYYCKQQRNSVIKRIPILAIFVKPEFITFFE